MRKETLKKIGRKLFVEKVRRKHSKNEEGNTKKNRKETFCGKSQEETPKKRARKLYNEERNIGTSEPK